MHCITGPLRKRHVDLFEIGVGCGMIYGPGKSILTWREFLSDVRLTMLEHDAKCAEKYRSQIDRLYIGDQTNVTLLEEIVRAGPYDVVIDDAGHSRKQQITSLIMLWPSVKTGGGFYVVEDILYNYDSFRVDAPETSFEILTKIMHFLVFQEYSSLNPAMVKTKISFGINKLREIANTVLSVNCYKMACVLVKK
jgi:hypothetical protein